ncbi:MAG: DUF4384 domain-containing protein [Gammaproteobacteria bacterium]|nr:DUF4384 domain-containing protein [Gammaproteobacteria bacterium]NNJ49761.1 DUF4384 domain-containing protein [Gammaproteobacteria bacterium]
MYYKIFSCLLLALSISGCSVSNNAESPSSSKQLDAIPLELTTHLGDQQQFVEGDEIQFLLSLGQDAYIYMFYMDASGIITQILPNANQPSHFYSAGYFLTIPEYENLYRFTISAPFGEESVWIIASDQSITLPESLVSLQDIRNTIKHSSIKAYGEYALRITTRARSGL